MAKRQERAERQLARMMLQEYPEEAALILESAPTPEVIGVLERERGDVLDAVFRRLTPDRETSVIEALPPDVSSRLLRALSPNRAAAVLGRLESDTRERCLAALDRDAAAELREMTTYTPDTAGGLMDPRTNSFQAATTVREVTRRLRRLRAKRVTDIFVVDSDGVLTGSIPLQDIVLADPETHLEGLVSAPPISVQAVASKEEAIETFETHRVASLPVVDFDGHLVGVLRQRELIQVAQDNATARAVRMVGASAQERALSSPAFTIRKRLPWLAVNLLTAFLASAVVALFEDTIARVTALAVLLPVVAGQSGNTGAQALAVTMRGLALREIRTRHSLRVGLKELAAGAGNGAAIALPTALAVFIWSGSPGLACVIGVSMVLSMTLAGASGAAVPMVLTALHQDPAQSSSIILTTITDVVGFLSFLGIATVLIEFL